MQTQAKILGNTLAQGGPGEQQARERGRGLPQHQARVRQRVAVLPRDAAHARAPQRRPKVHLPHTLCLGYVRTGGGFSL